METDDKEDQRKKGRRRTISFRETDENGKKINDELNKIDDGNNLGYTDNHNFSSNKNVQLRDDKRKMTLDKTSFNQNRKKIDSIEFKDAKAFWLNHQGEYNTDEEVLKNTKNNAVMKLVPEKKK